MSSGDIVYCLFVDDYEGDFLIGVYTSPEQALEGAQRNLRRAWSSRRKLAMRKDSDGDLWEIYHKASGEVEPYFIRKQELDSEW